MTNSIEYGFGRKNNWRRRVWNNAAEMLKHKKKDAICLYLAGETDLDYQIAVNKGFNGNNLIAVNKDKKIVNKLRAKKRLAFCGDIFTAVREMPEKIKIDFLHLDLCIGLQNNVIDLNWLIISGRLSEDAVICVNLQRGRDAESNEFRSDVALHENVIALHGEVKKHRGMFLFIHLLSFLSMNTAIMHNSKTNEYVAMLLMDKISNKHYWKRYMHWVKAINDPLYMSYKSGDKDRSGVYMDSVLFQMPFSFGFPIDSMDKIIKGSKKAKQSLTAISAVRTRRINQR